MKNTKENVVELLRKELENARHVREYFKEKGDKLYEAKYMSECIALQNAIWLLTDEEYFNLQNDIFNRAE